MDSISLIEYTGALLVAAGSPGPSIAALVAHVLARGHQDVMPFLAAMWIGEAIWLSCAVWGLASIAETFQLTFQILKWAGVCYLLYLAWNIWRAPVEIKEDAIPSKRSSSRMFAAGLAVTLGNPKIMFFYLAFLPTIIDIRHLTVLEWGELVAAMFVVLAFIDIAWVVFAARARLLLKSPRAVRIANRGSALTMASAATFIATR